jgi:hypothetical protein
MRLDNCSIGSPRQGNSRTSSLNLTLLVGVTLAARGASRLAYHFEGAAPPGCFEPPRGPARSSKQHRNPIALAQEWQRALDDGECPSRAALARQLGVTRARVTQVLGLLDLAPEVVHAIAALGGPLPRPIVSERMLRPLLTLPAGEQKRALEGVWPTVPSCLGVGDRSPPPRSVRGGVSGTNWTDSADPARSMQIHEHITSVS